MEMGGGDGGGLLMGCFLKGSLRQMIELAWQAPSGLEKKLAGGRLEGIGADAHFLEPNVQIGLGVLLTEGGQLQREAQTSQQRSVDAHVEAGWQLLIADQQQAKGRLGVTPVADQQTDFLQGSGA